MPPCPGIMSPKSCLKWKVVLGKKALFCDKKKLTLILKALLNPEAKKPPKGPIMELNRLREIECQM